MADSDFETELGRLFDRPPALADGDAFVRRVEQRLDRGWGVRQVLIGTAGLAGGLIGVGQLLRSGVVPRFEAMSAQSARAFSQNVGDLIGAGSLAALPMSGEVIWMAAALGAMALAFGLTRLIEEF